MTRAVVCGESLAAGAMALGLDVVERDPEIVLVDLSDAVAVARAATVDPGIPRIAVASSDQETLLRAIGSRPLLAPASTAAALGPLVAQASPRPARRPTRCVLTTGTAGGCGRTLLAVNLALRLAKRRVLLIDVTGTGRAARMLGLTAPSWRELEGLVAELTPEHVAVVAVERDGLGVIGGEGAMPSLAICRAAVRAARGAADVVVVDAPPIPDERALELAEDADRVLVVVPARDPDVAVPIPGAWVVASGGALERIGEREVFSSLPHDPEAVRFAHRGAVGGRLGRTYDELAEILAVDATR